LGSGKTTFVQGLAKGLGIKDKILSPTFVLMKNYKIPSTNKQFYHIDCYRIKQAQDLSALGLEKLFLNPQNIIAIEWAERIKKILPEDTIVLNFKFKNQEQREIRAEYIF
jgi:tRNA threonylcarbamoyladenosine biosynthesis protein TsaE